MWVFRIKWELYFENFLTKDKKGYVCLLVHDKIDHDQFTSSSIISYCGYFLAEYGIIHREGRIVSEDYIYTGQLNYGNLCGLGPLIDSKNRERIYW